MLAEGQGPGKVKKGKSQECGSGEQWGTADHGRTEQDHGPEMGTATPGKPTKNRESKRTIVLVPKEE